MSAQLAFLEVQGPEGQTFEVALDKDGVTIGRFHDFNDVALEPDPQQFVTRKAHCVIEHDGGSWWLVDNGSVNRTFLRRGERMSVVDGRASLGDEDVICILGKLTETGHPMYWELTFRDPQKTRPVEEVLQVAYLQYDWLQAKLYRVDGREREEIEGLRPQEHKMIRYMDHRNRANGGVPVMCAYEELITAVWGDDPYHTEGEVSHLVWELRQKIEPDSKSPRFLQTVRGLGYRLVTRPTPK